MLFSGNVAPWVAKVGFLFPRFRASICESSQQNVHQTVARARFAFQNVKQLSRSERFLECARDCSEFDFRKKSQKTAVRRLAPDLCGGVPIVSAVRRLVDLLLARGFTIGCDATHWQIALSIFWGLLQVIIVVLSFIAMTMLLMFPPLLFNCFFVCLSGWFVAWLLLVGWLLVVGCWLLFVVCCLLFVVCLFVCLLVGWLVCCCCC